MHLATLALALLAPAAAFLTHAPKVAEPSGRRLEAPEPCPPSEMIVEVATSIKCLTASDGSRQADFVEEDWYFKLSFQTKQELIEKGVCGDDVPECSESPNRGTCQKVIDGVEQFVSCGCCQRKPAAFPPPPGSAELDSNQWLNVSPKTTFVLDAGYGAEAPTGCEQPFTEYKHASQFSPYEPMARQVQDGVDVANPAYKNGRYELDPYAFPVGVYTDSSDYSFTA